MQNIQIILTIFDTLISERNCEANELKFDIRGRISEILND